MEPGALLGESSPLVFLLILWRSLHSSRNLCSINGTTPTEKKYLQDSCGRPRHMPIVRAFDDIPKAVHFFITSRSKVQMAKSQAQQMNEVGFDGPRTAWRGHWSMNLLLPSHERARSGYEMAPFMRSFFWFSSPSPRSLSGQRRKSEPMPPARGNFKLIDLAQGNLRAATSSLP